MMDSDVYRRRTPQQCIAQLRKGKTSGAEVAFRSDSAKQNTVSCTIFRFRFNIRKTRIVCL